MPEKLLDRTNVVTGFQQMRDGLICLRHRPVLFLLMPGTTGQRLDPAPRSEEYEGVMMSLPASLILI